MSEFESLDQPLLFKPGERALLGEINSLMQLRIGYKEVIEALNPADIVWRHFLLPFRLVWYKVLHKIK